MRKRLVGLALALAGSCRMLGATSPPSNCDFHVSPVCSNSTAPREAA